nr:hypothetical protein [Abalone asfa-like virus]
MEVKYTKNIKLDESMTYTKDCFIVVFGMKWPGMTLKVSYLDKEIKKIAVFADSEFFDGWSDIIPLTAVPTNDIFQSFVRFTKIAKSRPSVTEISPCETSIITQTDEVNQINTYSNIPEDTKQVVIVANSRDYPYAMWHLKDVETSIIKTKN